MVLVKCYVDRINVRAVKTDYLSNTGALNFDKDG